MDSKLVLQLIFNVEDGSTLTVNVEDPREDIETDEVQQSMLDILRLDILRKNELKLIGLKNARIVRTEITDIPVYE